MTWDDVVAIGRAFPEVTEATAYGEPALKVRKALLTRLRVADRSLVLLDVPAGEREMMIAAAPETFFCEPHYQGHDIVLARLEALTAARAQRLLERRWRGRATKSAIATFDRERIGGV